MATPGSDPFPTMARSSVGGLTAPQHLPFKFTDDTLIYIAVRISPSPTSPSPQRTPSKNPLAFLLPTPKPNHKPSKKPPKEKIKTIRLPRSEYLRHFARDTEGRYVGTEKEKEWSEAALQERFGRYWEEKPVRWVMGPGNGDGDGNENGN